MLVFYKSEYNPTGLTEQVGGNIGTTPLSGYLGELFTYISSPPSGTDSANQYRKVFVKNTYTTSLEYVRIWLDAVEHPEQISIANSNTYNDTSSGASFAPLSVSGWTSPTNFFSGLDLGTITPNTYTGFWIKQTLSGIDTPDPYATLRLYAGGVFQ